MRLIDQDQIGALDVVGSAMDRLDAGEQDLSVDLTPLEPRAVDAGRRLRPQAEELGVVLADQLAHVGDDENALIRPGLEHLPDELGHDQRFAAGGRNDDHRMAARAAEVVVDRIDRGALVRAELQAHAASLPVSRQMLPSAMR